jgi:spore maturation protein CgeB
MHILQVGSEYMYGLLRPACEQLGHTLALIPERSATPEAVPSAIAERKPRLLLAFADWSRQVPWSDLLDMARSAGIRTAFWNIEDPNHFHRFKEQCQGFDHLFTTAAECVGDYQARGHEDVSILTLAGAPSCHYRCYRPRDLDAIFVGNHYPDHPDRMVGEQNVLLPFLSRRWSLEVWGVEWWRGTPCEPFWQGLTQGPVRDYYARARIVLGMNEQRASPTMTSMRPYEALACGAFHLSDWSVAMENLFEDGRHLVLTRSAGETVELMDRYLWEEARREAIAREGQRYVYQHHTYAHRIQQMLTHLWPNDARNWFFPGREATRAGKDACPFSLSVRRVGSSTVPAAYSPEPPVAVMVLSQGSTGEGTAFPQTYLAIAQWLWLCMENDPEAASRCGEPPQEVPKVPKVHGSPLTHLWKPVRFTDPLDLPAALNQVLAEMEPQVELLIFCSPSFLKDEHAVADTVQFLRENPGKSLLCRWPTGSETGSPLAVPFLAFWHHVSWSIGGFRAVAGTDPLHDFCQRARAAGYTVSDG